MEDAWREMSRFQTETQIAMKVCSKIHVVAAKPQLRTDMWSMVTVMELGILMAITAEEQLLRTLYSKRDSEESSDVDDDEIHTSSGGNEDKDRVDGAPLPGNGYHVSDSNDNVGVNGNGVADDVCWKIF